VSTHLNPVPIFFDVAKKVSHLVAP
jgi:hypothetical protein